MKSKTSVTNKKRKVFIYYSRKQNIKDITESSTLVIEHVFVVSEIIDKIKEIQNRLFYHSSFFLLICE